MPLRSPPPPSTAGRTPPPSARTRVRRLALALAAVAALHPAARGVDSDPLDKPVLAPSMLTFLGSFQMPESANGWSTAFSQGGFALRYHDGNLQFFTTSHVYSGGLVYETSYPGIATSAPYPRATVVNNWGDIYSGQKVDNGDATLSSGCLTYGLLYDQATNGLYWTFGDWYNTAAPFNPSIGYSRLNDATGAGSGIGAWCLSNRPEHLERGGATRIPSWFAQRFTGGNTLGVGFGGYYSIIGSGSLGPTLAAIPDPSSGTYADDSALPNTPLLGYQPAGGSGFGQRTPDYINREPPGPWTGTVQGASSTTVVADNLLKATGTLADSTVLIASGPGAGQARDIIAWDYPSQTATLAKAWSTLPVAGSSTYQIYGGYAQGGTASTIRLKSATSAHDYAGMYLIITAGSAAGSPEQLVTAWDQSTQTATLTPGYGTPPDSSSRYEYYSSGYGARSVPDPSAGVGYWTWSDTIGGGAWIDTPDTGGLLVLGMMGTGHVYYEASNLHSDGSEFEFEIYSPKDLASVAQGADESSLVPTSIWVDPNLPSPNSGMSVGGLAFDPTTNRLYVLIEGVYQDGVEWHPQVYVYQLSGSVGGGTASGTASGTSTATSTASGTGSASATASGTATSGSAPPSLGGGGSHCGLGFGLGLVAALGLAWARRARP